MIRSLVAVSLLVGASVATTTARSDDESCRRVFGERVKACAEDCIALAKKAVDPEIRDRIKGYGCWNNCSKLEMFNGHGCPGKP